MNAHKLKIIYLTNVRMPTEKAHGRQIFKMCAEFARLGAKLELWVPRRHNALRQDPFAFYGLGGHFKIKRIFSLDLFFLEKIIGRSAFWLQLISFYFFALIRILFVSRPKLIYTRDWGGCLLAVFGFKVVYECHSIPKKSLVFFKLARLADKLIVVSRGLKELFIKNGIKKEKILVAPDAVDLSIFTIDISKEEARRQLNLPQDKRLLIYTGKFKTMGQDKGINDILAALKKLPGNITFLAIGGSQQEINYYSKQAHNLGVADKVKFLPHTDQHTLAVYQQAADILLMPFPWSEHYAYYMSPLKMFEYLAAGRPIIATDLPATREVLNNKNAILIKPGQPEELARAIERVIADHNLAQAISEQAYQDAKKYTWEKRTERILGFIETTAG